MVMLATTTTQNTLRAWHIVSRPAGQKRARAIHCRAYTKLAADQYSTLLGMGSALHSWRSFWCQSGEMNCHGRKKRVALPGSRS